MRPQVAGLHSQRQRFDGACLENRIWHQPNMSRLAGRLIHPRFQTRGVGHHFLAPGRIEGELYGDAGHVGHGQHLAPDIFGQEFAHPATDRGQGHHYINVIAISAERRDVAFVDQAEVNDVDRDLRVVTGLQLRPDQGLVNQAVARERFIRRCSGVFFDLEAERVGIAGVDTGQIAVDIDGIAAAERLGDQHHAALRQDHGRAHGYEHGLAVAVQADWSVFLHEGLPGRGHYSVLTGCSSPRITERRVCQHSEAHFTRAG